MKMKTAHLIVFLWSRSSNSFSKDSFSALSYTGISLSIEVFRRSLYVSLILVTAESSRPDTVPECNIDAYLLPMFPIPITAVLIMPFSPLCVSAGRIILRLFQPYACFYIQYLLIEKPEPVFVQCHIEMVMSAVPSAVYGLFENLVKKFFRFAVYTKQTMRGVDFISYQRFRSRMGDDIVDEKIILFKIFKRFPAFFFGWFLFRPPADADGPVCLVNRGSSAKGEYGSVFNMKDLSAHEMEYLAGYPVNLSAFPVLDRIAVQKIEILMVPINEKCRIWLISIKLQNIFVMPVPVPYSAEISGDQQIVGICQ